MDVFSTAWRLSKKREMRIDVSLLESVNCMRNILAWVRIDNIRVGELCDDTDILCNIFPYLRTRSQFLLIKKWSGGSRTASSVRVKCKQFRMNKMLPQSVRYLECEGDMLLNMAHQKYIDPVSDV